MKALLSSKKIGIGLILLAKSIPLLASTEPKIPTWQERAYASCLRLLSHPILEASPGTLISQSQSHKKGYYANEIESGIFLSARPETVEDIMGLGVDIVFNVSNHYEPEGKWAELPPSVFYRRFPLKDEQVFDETLATEAVLALADAYASKKRFLIHCSVGASRSPTILAVLLMARDGLSWEQAVARLKAKRPLVDPHPRLLTEEMRTRIVDKARKTLNGDSIEFAQ